MFLKYLIWVFIFLFSFSLVLSQNIETGNLQIIVQSEDKAPLYDAIVRIDCPSDLIQKDSYFTDKMGEVNINSISAEKCFLRVGYDKYIHREYVNITQGETSIKIITFEDIKLKKQILFIISVFYY